MNAKTIIVAVAVIALLAVTAIATSRFDVSAVQAVGVHDAVEIIVMRG